jgi:hypothetical protein
LNAVRRSCGALWPASLLAGPRLATDGSPLNDIRQTMLQTLDSAEGPGRIHAFADRRIAHRIRLCRDASALWYLRSELMHVLSAQQGEREARCQLDSLNGLFDGLLPPGLHVHRAPLR